MGAAQNLAVLTFLARGNESDKGSGLIQVSASGCSDPPTERGSLVFVGSRSPKCTRRSIRETLFSIIYTHHHQLDLLPPPRLRWKYRIGGNTSEVNTAVPSLPSLPLCPTARRCLACRIIRTAHSRISILSAQELSHGGFTNPSFNSITKVTYSI